MLNREWVLAHLKEAKEELGRAIDKIETDAEYDEDEFKIAIGHIYTHLNTAWNERKAEIVGNDNALLFPSDIAKEIRTQVRHIKRTKRAWKKRERK
ncbi:MAG: hypothetical protein DRI61_04495 [Chloroflexi bacterium]|nr:MAG: hypothetical protein DRI61_04495 [Chloroflexota bacterium]